MSGAYAEAYRENRRVDASSVKRRTATLDRQRLRELRAGGGDDTGRDQVRYALNVDGESRLIDIASEFSDEVTFLGAHVVPEEYVKDREGLREPRAWLDAPSLAHRTRSGPTVFCATAPSTSMSRARF